MESATTRSISASAFGRVWGFFFFFALIYLFLAVLDLGCCASFSLVEASGSYSLIAVHGLLIAVASLVVEHGL